jgi:hypothetical protein
VQQSGVPGDRSQQRKQYRITAAGKKYLLEQVGTLDPHEAGRRRRIPSARGLFDMMPQEKRSPIIRTRKTFLTARIAELATAGYCTAGVVWGACAGPRSAPGQGRTAMDPANRK